MNMLGFQGKTMGAGPRRAKGFTLIELMISLLLGLLLTGGIISVFIEGKRNFVQDDEVSRVQENGRYALRLLSREIGMAGFFGGVPDSASVSGGPVTTDCGPSGSDWLLDGAAPLEMIDDSDSSTIGASYTCLSGVVVDDTDVLAIKRVSDSPVIQDGEYQSGLTGLVSNRYYLHNKNRGLGAVDLKKGSQHDLAEIVVANNGSDVWEYYASIFYIGTGDDGTPSLCKREILSTGTGISGERCLVSGVENLQFELGMDNDADGFADQFVSNDTDPPIASAEDADNIVAVRIHVLARSINEINNFPAESRSYRLGGGTTVTTPVDRFYRLALSATVVIRNPTSLVSGS